MSFRRRLLVIPLSLLATTSVLAPSIDDAYAIANGDDAPRGEYLFSAKLTPSAPGSAR
jgi:hypothetical protein